MPIMNEFLCGHIVFLTQTVVGGQPTTVAGAYNASVTRNGNAAGSYIVRVGAALAPPVSNDLDASLSVSLNQGGAWSSATLSAPTLDPVTQDRLYQVDVVDAPAGLVLAADTAGTTVRLTIKRVEPRTS